MKRVIFILLTILPLSAWAEGDDFCVWAEVGIEKEITKQWSVGLSGELRTEDNSRKVSRWTLNPWVEYKVNKYIKFGVGYSFMDYYRSWSYKDHLNSAGDWNGYNVKNSHWMPRHRFTLDATGGFKPTHWLKLSVRERYQFTYKHAVEHSQEKYRYEPNEDYSEYVLKDGYPLIEDDESETGHMLRSRFKAEIDKKKLDWSPFVSVEFHNNLSNRMNMDKVRAIVGTSYKISKHHSINWGYVFTRDLQDSQNIHALSVGYNYKL